MDRTLYETLRNAPDHSGANMPPYEVFIQSQMPEIPVMPPGQEPPPPDYTQPPPGYDPVTGAMASIAGLPPGVQLPQVPAVEQQAPTWGQQAAANPLLMAGLSIMQHNGNIGAAGLGLRQAAGQQNVIDQIGKRNAQQKFDNEIKLAQLKRSGNRLPENIREIEELKARYPDLSDEEALSMAFTGRIPGAGSTIVEVGGRLYRKEEDDFGRPTYHDLTPEEQSRSDAIVAGSAGTRQAAVVKAAEVEKRRQALSTAYQEAAQVLPQQIASRRRLLQRLESGDVDSSVFFANEIGRLDPDVAALNAEGVQQLVEMLSKVSTGGLTDKEREAFAAGVIGGNKTVDVNKRLLKDQIAKLEKEYGRMSRLRKQYQDPAFDPGTWMPEMEPLNTIGPDATPGSIDPDRWKVSIVPGGATGGGF